MGAASWATMPKLHLLSCALPWMLLMLMLACGDPDEALPDEAEAALTRDDASEAENVDTQPAEPPFESILQRCYAQAPAREQRHEVHTVGRYLALGDTMLAVQVAIPHAPQLARCIEDAVASSVPPGPPMKDNEMDSGSFAIDLGGPRPAFREGDFERQFEEHQRGMKALMRKVVARGVLPKDHPLVREVLEAR